jgi:hypothetical protein
MTPKILTGTACVGKMNYAIVRSCDLIQKGNISMARPSIAELEAILQREDEVEIEILPNGEVRAKNQTTSTERGGRKPLTMREDLGGEYGAEKP